MPGRDAGRGADVRALGIDLRRPRRAFRRRRATRASGAGGDRLAVADDDGDPGRAVDAARRGGAGIRAHDPGRGRQAGRRRASGSPSASAKLEGAFPRGAGRPRRGDGFRGEGRRGGRSASTRWISRRRSGAAVRACVRPLCYVERFATKARRSHENRRRAWLSLVIAFVGPDRAGLVSAVSDAVAAHGGTWLESRLARLAGQFAGVVRADAPAERTPSARSGARRAARPQGHRHPRAAQTPSRRSAGCALELLGLDRPGIVRDATRALAGSASTSSEFETDLRPAPFSGAPMFHAEARPGGAGDRRARRTCAPRSKASPAN